MVHRKTGPKGKPNYAQQKDDAKVSALPPARVLDMSKQKPPSKMTKEGKKIFNELKEDAQGLICDKFQLRTFAGWCEQWAIVERCNKIIDEYGEAYNTGDGITANSATTVRDRAYKTLLSYSERLGFSPLDKQKLTRGPQAGENHGKPQEKQPDNTGTYRDSTEARRARLYGLSR